MERRKTILEKLQDVREKESKQIEEIEEAFYFALAEYKRRSRDLNKDLKKK